MLAVSGIVRNKGKLLLCKRNFTSAYSGMWEFPTEPIEDEETLEEALERHFFERLSVLPKSIKLIKAVDLPLYGGIRLYLADVELENCCLDNVYGYSDCRWLKVEDLANYSMAPASVRVIKEFVC